MMRCWNGRETPEVCTIILRKEYVPGSEILLQVSHTRSAVFAVSARGSFKRFWSLNFFAALLGVQLSLLHFVHTELPNQGMATSV